MQPVRYLFYRLYLWQVDCWKDDKVFINALALVVVLLWMNLVTLVEIAESLCGASFLMARLSHVGTLMLMALIAVPLYFMLLHAGKSEGIVKYFESESAHQRRSRGLGVSLYVTFSVVSLFGVAILHGQRI